MARFPTDLPLPGPFPWPWLRLCALRHRRSLCRVLGDFLGWPDACQPDAAQERAGRIYPLPPLVLELPEGGRWVAATPATVLARAGAMLHARVGFPPVEVSADGPTELARRLQKLGALTPPLRTGRRIQTGVTWGTYHYADPDRELGLVVFLRHPKPPCPGGREGCPFEVQSDPLQRRRIRSRCWRCGLERVYVRLAPDTSVWTVRYIFSEPQAHPSSSGFPVEE